MPIQASSQLGQCHWLLDTPGKIISKVGAVKMDSGS